jgi:uncharacterized protein YkwD
MIRRRLASIVLALLLGAALAPANVGAHPSACSSAHVAVVSRATVRQAQEATLCLLNRARAQAGLPPLRLNRRLSKAASGHSHEMVRHHYFAHESANGRSAFDRIFAVHYVPRHANWSLGENIGWGSATLAQPVALVRMWMHSPPHRANILSRRFRDIGIGITPGTPRRHGRRGATYTTDFGAHS